MCAPTGTQTFCQLSDSLNVCTCTSLLCTVLKKYFENNLRITQTDRHKYWIAYMRCPFRILTKAKYHILNIKLHMCLNMDKIFAPIARSSQSHLQVSCPKYKCHVSTKTCYYYPLILFSSIGRRWPVFAFHIIAGVPLFLTLFIPKTTGIEL